MQVCTDPFYPLSILHVYCTDTDTSLIWHLEQNIFISLYYFPIAIPQCTLPKLPKGRVQKKKDGNFHTFAGPPPLKYGK